MINNLFDAHIKEQMANSRPDVPPHIWDNIMAKKERKKPIVFWFNNFSKGIVFLLIAITVGGIVFYTTTKLNNAPLHTNIYALNSTNLKAAQKNKFAVVTDPTLIQPSQEISTLKEEDKNLLLKPITSKNQKSFLAGFLKEVNASPSYVEVENKSNSYSFQNDYTFKPQIFNVELLKSNFFNPDLQKRYLPKSPFIPCPEIEKNAAGRDRKSVV